MAHLSPTPATPSLEPVIRPAISDWLNIEQHPYDFEKWSDFKDQMVARISINTPSKKVLPLVRSEIKTFRFTTLGEEANLIAFDSWSELEEELVDVITARIHEFNRNQELRNAV